MNDQKPNLESEIRCAHVLISGRVQGVGFRAATESMALNAGVRGWVRNLRDGRVEALFEGSSAAVESMVRWCHHGNPVSHVEKVEISHPDPSGLSSFEIRPTLR